MAGNSVKERAREGTPGGVTTSSTFFVSPDVLSLGLEPLDTPLVIGQRGLTELLGDLAVATDDLSS
jgi:hypothetical protein